MEISPHFQRYGEYSIPRTLLQIKKVPWKRTAADRCCNIAGPSNHKHLAAVTLVEENDCWRQFLSNFNLVLTIGNVSTLEYTAIATVLCPLKQRLDSSKG